jgi:hypothetical protein
MKRSHRIVIAVMVAAVATMVGLKAYVTMTPLVEFGSQAPTGELFDRSTKVGQVFASVSECADKQKGLFGYIEAYKKKNGRLPDSIHTLINDDPGSLHFTSCPSKSSSYVIHPDAYGNPKAVFISEEHNQHSTTFKLWLRGIRPSVQTVGDGTIHLFEGGKLATLNARSPGSAP